MPWYLRRNNAAVYWLLVTLLAAPGIIAASWGTCIPVYLFVAWLHWKSFANIYPAARIMRWLHALMIIPSAGIGYILDFENLIPVLGIAVIWCLLLSSVIVSFKVANAADLHDTTQPDPLIR